MDLSFLRSIFEQPPGQQRWASVYLDASHDTEDAAHAIELRWRAAREELERAGADEATLDAIADVATGPPQSSGSHGLAIFATDGRVVHTDVLPDPPRTPLARWDPLPHAMPAVAQRGERVAWLRVVVDRTGADLVGATAGGLTRSASVQGSNSYPMHLARRHAAAR